MAETTRTAQAQPRQDQSTQARGGEAARERTQSAAEATEQAVRRGASGTAQALQSGAGALRRGAEAGAETTEETGRAAEEMMRGAGEITAETTRRTTRTLARGGRRLVEDAAGEVEEIGHRIARAVEETTGEMRRMMVLPQLADGGMRQAQRAMGELMDGMARANLRVAREIMRLADPSPMFDLQRRILREYAGALVESGVEVLRSARRSAEETLRPIEEQLEEAQGRRGGEEWGARRRQGQQHGHRVTEVMRTGTRMVGPEDTVQQAARLMAEEDTSVLPVGEEGRLIGVVTGRDLAVRLIAEGRDPARTRVREVMRAEPPCAFEDEDTEQAVETMTGQQIVRLPVVSRDDRRFLGVVALSDLAPREMAGHEGGAARRSAGQR